MLKRRFAIILFLTSLAFQQMALAQAPARAVYTAPKDEIEKIKEEGLKHSQVMQTLSYLTDVIGARLTGSPSMKHANEWTRDTMTKWGMQNAHLEAWGPFGRGWSLKAFRAEMVDPQFVRFIAYPKAWSPSTNGAVTSDVVWVEAKNAEEMAKYKGQLKGKIVLASGLRPVKPVDKALSIRITDEDLAKMAASTEVKGDDEMSQFTPDFIKKVVIPYFNDRAAIVKFLKDEGAAVMIDAGNNGSGGTVFVQEASVGTGITNEIKSIYDLFTEPAIQPYRKGADADMLPQVTMASEDYNRLIRMLQAGAKPRMTVEIAAQYHEEDPMSYNTIAEIPGTDPKLKDEVVMLGGHMDSWHTGTGATDNGAGVAAAMEAARILIAAGLKPRRTVRVALWSGEEQGIYGSAAYVKQHFGEIKDGKAVTKPEAEKLSAYYNLDNGTGKIRGVYMQGNAAVKPYFEAWLAPFADSGAKTVTISNTGGTDHLSFDAVGLPGFQFIQDPLEYDTRTHHSNQDVFDRVQADDLKQAATILAAFVYQTAMMDERLPRKAVKE